MKHKAGAKKGHSMVSLGNILAGLFPNIGLSNVTKELDIRKNWTAIVGENISKRAEPVRLKNKTLYVAVTSSAWMNELIFQKDDIVKKTNEIIGVTIVDNLIFKPSNSANKDSGIKPQKRHRRVTMEEKNFIADVTEGVKDAELREVIKRAFEKTKSASP